VLPAYISIEQYERNMQRLDANRSRAQSLGAVRDGPALLAGLVVCGRCDSKMTVRYQRGRGGKLHPVYVCSRDKSDYAAAQCQQLAGPCVDAHVTDLLLAAMAPAALEVSLAAAGQLEAQREQADRIWRQRLERAEFAADRARRQYQLAEPENRLVVRQLEKDWEVALAERQRLGEEYDRFTVAGPRTLTAAEREQIQALAADLPGVWDAPTTTDADRKQLIRHLVEQVRVTVAGISEKVDVEVIWAGGHRTAAQITRPVACLTQLSYYPQLAARARELAEAGFTMAQIAERFNAEDFRPPKRSPVFTPNAVSDLLRALGIQRSHIPAGRNRPALDQHEWWLRDLATHLGMPEVTLDHWVRRGWATGYLHPQARLRVVRADPAEVKRLRALHQVPRGQHNRRPWLSNQAASMNTEREGTNNADEPRL
jgi:Recombinase zinc beta ribbon domain